MSPLINKFNNYLWGSTPVEWSVSLETKKNYIQATISYQYLKVIKKYEFELIQKYNDNIEDLVDSIVKELKLELRLPNENT